MVTEAELIKDVRLELDDTVEPFRDTFRGNGDQREFNLSAQSIIPSSVTARYVTFATIPVEVTLNPGSYTLNAAKGFFRMNAVLPRDALLTVEGDSYGIFSDTELSRFVLDATYQHLNGRTVSRRYRDGRGFIVYDREKMEIEDLPREEKVLVTLLATIEALWALSTSASLDIDIQTAEGTSIPRGQRFRQLQTQIDLLTQKYTTLSLLLGVGLYAPEAFNIRRISRSTGRLIPIFQAREYDETGPPVRKNVAANTKSSDPDGPASPIYPSWGY